MNEIGSVLKNADILLVHLTDDELFSITIPSRTQAYLAVGKPIVMAVKGDAAQLVESSEAGVTCEPDQPEALAKAISVLCDKSDDELINLGEKGKQFYFEHLSVESGVRQFVRTFELVSRKHSG